VRRDNLDRRLAVEGAVQYELDGFPETGGFVQNCGTFVGGFFANESSIPLTNVYLQATCGQVPVGYTEQARDHTARATYQTQLRAARAALK
jgi:hypothetical protein